MGLQRVGCDFHFLSLYYYWLEITVSILNLWISTLLVEAVTHCSQLTFIVCGFIAISSLCQFFPSFYYSFLFTWAELTNNLTESLKAGGSNSENGEVRDQGRYHHGTKETIFDFWGFNDITFSFAPVTFPLEFFSLWCFATNLPITVLPTLSFLLSPPVPFSNSVLVY